MNPLFEAARDVQQFFTPRGWRSAVIGGLAVQRWGEPRQTRDVDLALLTGFGEESRYIEQTLERYRGRRPDARQFALEYRVLLVETAAGVPLDISLAALPFEQRTRDTIRVRSGVHRHHVCRRGPGRLESVRRPGAGLARHRRRDRPAGTSLDRELILEELLPLLELKEDSAPGETLRRLFRKHP